MKKLVLVVVLLAIGTVFYLGGTQLFVFLQSVQVKASTPPGLSESQAPSLDPWQLLRQNWKRPEGPPKVAIQVGHWKNHEVPEELENLKANTGASGGGYTEVAANLIVAEQTAELLRAQGIHVEVLPTTVPPEYWADVFISIHADGSTDSGTRGFKIASPWRDLSGKADRLVSTLEEIYGKRTALTKDNNITRNMRGYYAFSWWRYEHAIHPMTTAAIVEMGFITNASDRKIIVHQPERVSNALAEGITKFLTDDGLLKSNPS